MCRPLQEPNKHIIISNNNPNHTLNQLLNPHTIIMTYTIVGKEVGPIGYGLMSTTPSTPNSNMIL